MPKDKYIKRIETGFFDVNSNNSFSYSKSHGQLGRSDGYSNIATKMNLDDYYKIKKAYDDYIKTRNSQLYNPTGVQITPDKPTSTSGLGHTPVREQLGPTSTVVTSGKGKKYIVDSYTTFDSFESSPSQTSTSGLGHTPVREQLGPTSTVVTSGKGKKYIVDSYTTFDINSGTNATPNNNDFSKMFRHR